MRFTVLYPQFRKKAVTFSYDDGVIQDAHVVKILNDHHLKGTFNLNSGLWGEKKIRNGMDCSRLPLSQVVTLYAGHEIASHTLNHPHLPGLSLLEQKKEFVDDVAALQNISKNPIIGAAYPYGTYDVETLEALRYANIYYARTTRSTYAFSLPVDFRFWHPTIHHDDPLLEETLKRFALSQEELACFYLWGHAYEFALQNNWDILENFCVSVANDPEVWSATNGEIYHYVLDAESLYDDHSAHRIVNPSMRTVYVQISQKRIAIGPVSSFSYGGLKA